MYCLLQFQQKHIIRPSDRLPFGKPAIKHNITNDGIKLLYTFDYHIINKNRPDAIDFLPTGSLKSKTCCNSSGESNEMKPENRLY